MLGSDGADVALDAGARDAGVAPAGVPGDEIMAHQHPVIEQDARFRAVELLIVVGDVARIVHSSTHIGCSMTDGRVSAIVTKDGGR